MERVVVQSGSFVESVPAAFLLKQNATFSLLFFPTGQSAGYLRRARSELHLRAAGPAKVL